ncbi:Nicotinamide phosphoribosyltransferase [Durusdinium trenchii]|uniref:Nicotinamide phosphoribosyltransferase n=1 Tax=Durusdinium trenchii TaxID=1381693 RepID=A0ABP0RAT5_9DINO
MGRVAGSPSDPCDDVDIFALAEFFQFLQCQVRLEAKLCLGEKDVQLEDPDAKCLWPLFEQWVAPNIGKREKWVPFHTVLAPHELFLVQSIHHNTDLNWSDFQRYLAIFIFRAHCQRQVFSHAQLPYLLTADFWHDPKKYFDDDGPITQSMMKYRRETHLPLQTGAFLSIPERLLEDNDENLVINVARRTQRLLDIAMEIWPTLQNPNLSNAEKFQQISRVIQTGHGFGETWAKMLMVSMDIAFPAAKLLSTHCEVGIGAREGLDRLFANQGPRQAVEALSVATAAANNSQMKPARHFWRIVERVEGMARQTFADLPLVLEHIAQFQALSPATVQVQLCEWRQFLQFIERRSRLPAPEIPSACKILDDDEDETAERSEGTPVPEAISSDTSDSDVPEMDNISEGRLQPLADPRPSLGAPEAENRSGKDAEKHYVEAVGQVLQNYKARHEELFGSVLSCSLRAQEEDARCQAASLKYFEICAAEMESQRDLRACLLEGYKHSAREEPLRRQVKTLDKTLEILKPAESEDVRQGLQSEGQEGLAPEDASEVSEQSRFGMSSSSTLPPVQSEAFSVALPKPPPSMEEHHQRGLRVREAKLKQVINDLGKERERALKRVPRDDEISSDVERLRKRHASMQSQKERAEGEMRRAEAKRASAERELVQRKVLLVNLKADIDAMEEMLVVEDLMKQEEELSEVHSSRLTFKPCSYEACHAARRAGGLAFLLLSAAGCAFLAPMPQIAAPAAQMAATQLLLAEIDMTEPYRPEEEPESPANIMIFLTLTFVLAAFILPLLFAGIQSKNADIAGADERGKPAKK